jgi:hypothetical protein
MVYPIHSQTSSRSLTSPYLSSPSHRNPLSLSLSTTHRSRNLLHNKPTLLPTIQHLKTVPQTNMSDNAQQAQVQCILPPTAFQSNQTIRHRNPPGQGYPTGVLTLPYSGSQGQRLLECALTLARDLAYIWPRCPHPILPVCNSSIKGPY